MAVKKVTQAEYLAWMASSSRMNGWGAFVAYDRDKCNQLLLQEYIAKFDENEYEYAIDDTYADGDTIWNWVTNYQTDAPRLSFENNPDDAGNNVAEANLSIAVVGGVTVQLTGASKNPEVTKINSYDPLDHPELKADRVMLSDIQGGVDKDGKVVLDLGADATQRRIWELSGSRYQHERRMGGAFMKRKFREAGPERSTFTLGQLAYTDQDYLKPHRFQSRIVMEQGANLAKASKFGKGALELRIAMKDQPLGGFPGDDWLYPFPSDRPEVDASLMIGNKLLMREIIAIGAKRVFNSDDATFEEAVDGGGNIWRLKVSPSNGFLYVPTTEYSADRYRFRWFEIPIYINPDHRLTVTNYGDGNMGVGMGTVEHGIGCGVWIGDDLQIKQFSMGVNISGTFSFEVDPDLRRIIVKVVNFKVDVAVKDKGEISDAVAGFINAENSPLKQQITEHCKTEVAKIFVNAFEPIDAFVLHSLLFTSKDAIELKSVHAPGDLVSFGSISPRLTTFAINPQEKLLGYGTAHTFATSPVTTGVKWSVKNIDGTTSGAGQINESTGRYTAPGLDDIDGTFKRVKVTATAAGHTSTALVTIAARAITLNPLVQTCDASSDGSAETVAFSANAMTGALKWSATEGEIPEDANEDRTNVYTAPLKQPFEDKTFTIDEVKVTNTTGQVQSSFVVVKHNRQGLTIDVEVDGQAPGKAQFSASLGSRPVPDAVWSCFPAEGAGSIDQNGLYTADPTSQHQFVIITANFTMNDWLMGDNFSIQPLPLGALPPKPAPEIPQ
ncbi:hypothetical protein [Pseudomonas sp. TNT3]|uniref:hypothetical protein n=1 Tax=Pseudomonas sp. TNT3 TaxID=2654097 RepID=UPI0013919263|nr:hypothetical protein [Pseudomonas sp. TNT3]KAI2693183.1 hypothetical protein GBC55_006485 [Pseudomonas sp. TNT3]